MKDFTTFDGPTDQEMGIDHNQDDTEQNKQEAFEALKKIIDNTNDKNALSLLYERIYMNTKISSDISFKLCNRIGRKLKKIKDLNNLLNAGDEVKRLQELAKDEK